MATHARTVLPPRHDTPALALPRYMGRILEMTQDAGNVGESRTDSEEMRAATVRPGKRDAVAEMRTSVSHMLSTLAQTGAASGHGR